MAEARRLRMPSFFTLLDAEFPFPFRRRILASAEETLVFAFAGIFAFDAELDLFADGGFELILLVAGYGLPVLDLVGVARLRAFADGKDDQGLPRLGVVGG